MSLTEQELKDKIAMVEADIKRLSGQSFNDKQFSILSEYKEYLEDDLRLLQQSQNK